MNKIKGMLDVEIEELLRIKFSIKKFQELFHN